MKELRGAVPDREERDARILGNLCRLDRFAQAETVFLYKAFGTEAGTDLIAAKILADGRRIFYPRTEGEEILLVPYTGQPFRKGRFSCPEPEGDIFSGTPDVCIAPLLAADLRFRRLGYGGGFYDRYFHGKGRNVYKIGIGYDFQIESRIPDEAHDVPLDAIVSDKRILCREEKR